MAFLNKGLSITLTDERPEHINGEPLRYHPIILMADADVDGQHITTLRLVMAGAYLHVGPMVTDGATASGIAVDGLGDNPSDAGARRTISGVPGIRVLGA